MKKNRREKSKFPGFDKSVNLKIRHELLDFDYLHLLNDDEKKWLSNFMLETVSADFTHEGKKFYKSKKNRKAIYDANNARNRDSYSITKSNGMLKGMSGKDLGDKNDSKYDIINRESKQIKEFTSMKSTNPTEVEDTLIAVIDHFNLKKS